DRQLVRGFGQDANEILRRFASANLGDLRVHRLQVVGGLLIVLVEDAGVDVYAGIIGEELFLLGGAFVGGRVVSGPQLIAQGRFKFLEMLHQGFIDVLLLLRLLFFGKFLRFGFDFVGLLSVGIGVKRKQALVGCAPVLPVIRRLDHRAKPVVIGLRNRIVAMIVALRAADGQPKQRRGDDLDRF